MDPKVENKKPAPGTDAYWAYKAAKYESKLNALFAYKAMKYERKLKNLQQKTPNTTNY